MPYTSPVLRQWTHHARSYYRIVNTSAYSTVQLPWLRSTHPSSINPSQRPNAVTSQSPVSVNHEVPFREALDNSGSVARLVLVSIPSYLSTRVQGSSNPRALGNRQQLHNQVLNKSTLVEDSITSLTVASFTQCHHVPFWKLFLISARFLALYRLTKLLRLSKLAYPRGTIGM